MAGGSAGRIPHFARVTVLGGGAWGTALAQILADTGADADAPDVTPLNVTPPNVTLWARDPAVAAAIGDRHLHPAALPDIPLSPRIAATADLDRALADADLLVAAVPAQALRELLRRLRPLLAARGSAAVPVLLCAKGLEIATGMLLTDVVAEELPGHPAAVLSGPNFAGEVARRLPAAASVGAAERHLGEALVATFGRPWFRPYRSDDPIGVQVGGAYKNVLAIACGAVIGRALGENARAALLTRGIAEMARLTVALGGRAETCMGLSGIGDALLTCLSETSRNTRLGVAIGRGATLDTALAGGARVVEGVHTARAVHAIAQSRSLDLPVAAAVHAVLHQGADLESAMAALLARPFRAEDPAT
ncbi:NAD(P)H-dependent glycerol-3-phosphate dehydrogenase [Marinibaculum pumilum]|uniref:Glycerol-3-phosphate dehydrogenase [NAD(P)+] n=1 Tax=Marinibaculum pumilum TaxID=1766165 RepID=A0ABV7KY17_9PROT